MVSVSMTFRMKKATASEAVLAAAENILPYLLARPYLFAVAGIPLMSLNAFMKVAAPASKAALNGGK